jgi:hypothetical protein
MVPYAEPRRAEAAAPGDNAQPSWKIPRKLARVELASVLAWLQGSISSPAYSINSCDRIGSDPSG